MVIVWSQLLALSQSSVAVQVRVIVSELPQPGAEASLRVIPTPLQASVAVAAPVGLSTAHSTVTSGGQAITGSVVSTTVTV
jgi:hypothetical protein